MTAWGQVKEAAEKAVSRIRESFREDKAETFHAEMMLSPEQILSDRRGADGPIAEALRRMTRDANAVMLTERWARPGMPRFSFEVDDRDAAFRDQRPSYGPGTLRLRLDMQGHTADLKLPEANAELTKALIGALAVAATNVPLTDLPGRRLIEGARQLLHEHGDPSVITLMGAMVESATERKN